ncbi:DUF1788 domain-containing protein [Mariprofundus ferrooxydans]|uniref:DUF1788 domain-containing protein n=1 Tax=Mariprofundus ferrooxydans TaxID=314344 RepID=UPI0006A6A875|nr:DUF1788 domain-containing protein [Mariprofundus ferrooxydans]KON48502.1 hypothetical protein AL013_02410 [Mariprofundus ferrooxydans]
MIDGMATGSPEDFQHLLGLISSQRFLNKQGLGNEVPFFICPCDPKSAVAIERLVKQLSNQLETKGVHVLEVNLYDISLALLKKSGDLDWYLEHEQEMTKSALKDELQSILDTHEALIPAIVDKMEGKAFDVMFLTGVGEVFPYIRSHNVLNNLQSKAKDKPTVMFFSGAYTHSVEKGASLDLFARLRDDKYYRAFNIFDCEV